MCILNFWSSGLKCHFCIFYLAKSRYMPSLNQIRQSYGVRWGVTSRTLYSVTLLIVRCMYVCICCWELICFRIYLKFPTMRIDSLSKIWNLRQRPALINLCNRFARSFWTIWESVAWCKSVEQHWCHSVEQFCIIDLILSNRFSM